MSDSSTGADGAKPNEIADLVAPLWSASRTGEALELSAVELAAQREARNVLGLQPADSDLYFFPVAQFERRDGKIQVKPMLREFFWVLRERDPWTVGILLHTPVDELDGLTPLEWVRGKRDEEQLIGYARIVDAQFRR